MEKTRQHEDKGSGREFKLLVRKGRAAGGLSVAASSSGAWASDISLGFDGDGRPCCTAVVSLAPDMFEAAAAALAAGDDPDGGDTAAGESVAHIEPIGQAADRHGQKGDDVAEDAGDQQQGQREEQLEGRPFEQIAKGAKEKAASAKKNADAKTGSDKVVSKPSSGSRQASRAVSGGQQALVRR